MEDKLNSVVTTHTCPICLDGITDNNLSVTNCSHSFCIDCLDAWLSSGKYSCPMCRSEIKTFLSGNRETRIFPVVIRNESHETTPQVITSRAISSIIDKLIQSNLKLKYSLYLSLSTLLIMGNYYFRTKYYYDELIDKYNNCETNLSISQHLGIDQQMITTRLYEGDTLSFKFCDIPFYFYNKCFN